MNEREEGLEHPLTVDAPQTTPDAPIGKMEESTDAILEGIAGENQPRDSSPLGETERIGAGEQTDHQTVGEDSALDLPIAVPVEKTLESLRRELTDLRKQLLLQKQSAAQLEKDYKDFSALYPEIPLSEIPDAVWKENATGVPLSAAFACYERRKKMVEAAANLSNSENKRRSPGGVHSEENDYLSPAEVRSMTAEQVRKNYQRIMQSMTHWNHN